MKSKFFEQMHNEQKENECPPAWILEGFNSKAAWERDNYKDWKSWEMKDRINRSKISPEHKYYGLL